MSDSYPQLLCENCWNKIKSWRTDYINANHMNLVIQLIQENVWKSLNITKDFTSDISGLFPSLPLTHLEHTNSLSTLLDVPSPPPKIENICPFCVSRSRFILRDKSKSKIELCAKHSTPYTCLIENCFKVFTARHNFIKHYRSHKKLGRNQYFCKRCLAVVGCSKNTKRDKHDHETLSAKCCSIVFSMMLEFVMHKLEQHSAKVEIDSKRHTKQNILNKCRRYAAIKNEVHSEPSETVQTCLPRDTWGKYECKPCGKLCYSVTEFIEHSNKKHNNLMVPKDKAIRLCPHCDENYLITDYTSHLEKCIDTMKVGNNLSMNRFGCIYCRVIYNDLTPRQFLYHVIYCKSFNQVYINDIFQYEQCLNCTFKSKDRNTCAIHANYTCIYFKLKMMYAMKSNEKTEAHNRFMSVFNENQEISHSECKIQNRREIFPYIYFCNTCNKGFFSSNQFSQHMTETGEWCRVNSTWYCEFCVTNFDSEELFLEHKKIPVAETNIKLKVKTEETEEEDPREENIILSEDYGDAHNKNEESNFFVESCDRRSLNIEQLEDMETSNFDDVNISSFQKVEMLTDDETNISATDDNGLVEDMDIDSPLSQLDNTTNNYT